MAARPPLPRDGHRRWTWLAAVLLLTGCASVPGPAPELGDERAWAAQRAKLTTIRGFEVQGRLRSGGVAGASLNWRQDERFFDAHLSGPLGTGAVALDGAPDMVRIRASGEEWFTPDPEAWMQASLGWRLPVAGLRYWAVGLPAPGLPARYQVDGEGRLLWLEQDGWRLDYSTWHSLDALSLPRRIELDDGATRATLLIDRWLRVQRETPD